MKRALFALTLSACAPAPARGGAPPAVAVPEPKPVAPEPDEGTDEGAAEPIATASSSTTCPPPPSLTEANPPETIVASHLLVAYSGALRARPEITRSKPDARATAEELLQRLCAGESFAELARKFSDDPSGAQRDGSLGRFKRAVMVKRFSDAAFALVPGQLSGVVETEFGYHIILRTE